MRVLHILNELRPSGAETMLRSAASEWSRHTVESEILAIGRSIGPYASALRDAGYKVHHLPAGKSASFFSALWRFIREGKYEVVHQHVEGMGYWIGITSLIAGAKLVRTVHNNFQYNGALRLRRLIQRRHLTRLGAIFVSIAPGVQENERKRFGVPSSLIWNWVDPSVVGEITEAERHVARASFNIEQNEIVVVSVGNCSVVKNHGSVIEAISSFPESVHVRYLHVGMENDDCSEARLVSKLNCRDRVTFAGSLSNVRRALSAADIFVMPSLYEGFSIAALEALGAGLPMVLARVDGLRDLEPIFPDLIYVTPDASGVREGISVALSGYNSLRARTSAIYPVLVETNFGVQRGASMYSQIYAKALGH